MGTIDCVSKVGDQETVPGHTSVDDIIDNFDHTDEFDKVGDDTLASMLLAEEFDKVGVDNEEAAILDAVGMDLEAAGNEAAGMGMGSACNVAAGMDIGGAARNEAAGLDMGSTAFDEALRMEAVRIAAARTADEIRKYACLWECYMLVAGLPDSDCEVYQSSESVDDISSEDMGSEAIDISSEDMGSEANTVPE